MSLLWTVIAILLVLWLGGLLLNLLGPVIHVLLIAAAALFVVNMFAGRRTV